MAKHIQKIEDFTNNLFHIVPDTLLPIPVQAQQTSSQIQLKAQGFNRYRNTQHRTQTQKARYKQPHQSPFKAHTCPNAPLKSLTTSYMLKPSADESIVITLARLTLTILQAQGIRSRLDSLDYCSAESRDYTTASNHQTDLESKITRNDQRFRKNKNSRPANYTVKTGSSTAMAKKSLRFLKSVEDIPKTRKPRRNLYDEIIREFLYSETKCAEVKNLGKKPLTIQLALKNRLKHRKHNIQVLLRNKKVYLKRLDFLQQTRLPTGTTRRTPQPPSDKKPSFDIMYLPNTTIVRARCPTCKALNAKDSRACRDCGNELYPSEKEYQDSLEEMETLERSLNRKR